MVSAEILFFFFEIECRALDNMVMSQRSVVHSAGIYSFFACVCMLIYVQVCV